MDVLTICGWIAGVSAGLVVIWKLYKQVSNIIEGVKCQLRTVMVNTYYKYIEYKVIPQYEAENFYKCYQAYKSLNGNSFIDNIKNEVDNWTVEK